MELRVVDFGTVSPLRSQTWWHALAAGVGSGAGPTLSFMRPSAPYVSIGYHRLFDEVDQAYCRRRGLPVFRRMVGGGPVYLDEAQHFFQIIVPRDLVPASRPAALRALLAPAAEAFRRAGVPARLDGSDEIVVGDAKVCGHAAGEIDGAVVVVGNLITAFDHAAAAAIVACPHSEARRELRRLMERYVAATPADPVAFRDAAIAAYAAALGLSARTGEPSEAERARVAELDARFRSTEWLEGPVRPVRPGWRAKVRAGVWVYAAGDGASRLAAGFVGDRIDGARLADPELDGAASILAERLVGRTAPEAAAALRRHGEAGGRLATLLDGADGRGL